jgi:hypothetical protein
MPDLAELRRDLRAFAEAVGCPLADWQAEALTLETRTTAIVAPRQSGKSRTLAVKGLHWAYSRPAQRVLVVSAGEDASRRLLAEAAAVATRSPLLAASVVDENAGRLSLSNGSEVRSVPASERAVRGWSVDLLLIDEAAQVDDGLILGAAIPTTAARPYARIVLAGSPGGPEGAFYLAAEEGDHGSEYVRTFRWQLADATWIGGEVIEAARAQLPSAAFEREYEGRFMDVAADERVIPHEWVAAAQRRELEPGPVVYGVDIARRPEGDETVILRLAGGVARVEWARRGADLMQTSATIARLADDGWTPTIALDAIGLGMGVLDRLRELQVPVSPFIASARATRSDRFLNLRAEAWWKAREAFRLGDVDLDPDDRTLAAQLCSVRYGLTSSGVVQIASKESMRSSPDRADALVIALHARAQHEAGESTARLLERALREPPHPLLAGSVPVAAVDWLGGRRRPWREALDPDLPELR